MIPVKVWGLKQSPDNCIFSAVIQQDNIAPYCLLPIDRDDFELLDARTILKVQNQIISNNRSPNVQVIIIDHNDLESLDTDLFEDSFYTLSYLSYNASKTYLIFCDLTKTNVTGENFVEISDKLNFDLRRLAIYWPGRCYYLDLNQVIIDQDWQDSDTLNNYGQEKLAYSVIRVLLGTPQEVFN